MLYRLQNECPVLERYKKVFAVTDKTVIAYDKVIYSNEFLPLHLETHERRHLIRQQKQGVNEWVEKYLSDPDFRLHEEAIAYREQLDFIKDRDKRHKLRMRCAKDLSSPLYGNIVSYEDALKLLRTN